MRIGKPCEISRSHGKSSQESEASITLRITISKGQHLETTQYVCWRSPTISQESSARRDEAGENSRRSLSDSANFRTDFLSLLTRFSDRPIV